MSVLFRREPAGIGEPDPLSSGRAVVSPKTAARAGEVTKIVKQRLVTVEFQPLVRIGTGETVAFESFARGPIGSPLATPEAMFAAAGGVGLTGELDLVTANAAYLAAHFSPHRDVLTLFINIDPAGFLQMRDSEDPEIVELLNTARRAIEEFRVVVEIPEISLARDPLLTMSAAEFARQMGARLAVDNAGVSPQALPLLMFLRPDVIKLSPVVLTSPLHLRAPVLDAVATYTEQSGSLVVAQGIESDDHLQAALGLGATIGQGFHFGRPMTVPVAATEPEEPLSVYAKRASSERHETPFRLASADRSAVRVDLPMFQSLANYLLDGVEAATEPFVMVVVTSDGSFLSAGRAPRLRTLGHKASLLLVLTTNTDLVSSRDTSVGVLEPDDPLGSELVLAVISLTASSMLVCRPADDERYDCLLTHDRPLVQTAIDCLLGRVVGE